MIYGVKRTTIYLSEEMKTAIEHEAAGRGVTEAEVIRGAVDVYLRDSNPPMHELPLFPKGFGREVSARVDELLEILNTEPYEPT
jgi:hypothetical protein